jgi:hypothetical protein
MQSTNLRNQFHLYRYKIICVLVALLCCFNAWSQGYKKENLPNYDNELIHYGFFLGGHNTNFKLNYADVYLDNSFDSLHSIIPQSSPGFSVGFIFNLRLAQYVDFRVLPGVGLYQYTLNYNIYDDGAVKLVQGQKEAFYAEIPFLLKFKSQRRNNFRMYVVGGAKPSFEVSGKKAEDIQEERLLVNSFNLSYEFGFGVDIYYEWFKFSPEIRFSRGMTNALNDKQNSFSRPINNLVTNSVSIYLQFQ